MATRFGAISVNAAAGAQELVPDLIIPDVTASAARQEVFMPLARRFDRTGPGEVFTVPTAPSLAFATLGSQTYIDGTEPVETAFNTGGRTFTPRFYFLDVVVPLDVIQGSDSGINVQDEIVKEASTALAAHHDSIFAALYTEAPASSPDHETGVENTELNFTNLRANYELLLIQNAPRPYAWVVYPAQVTELLKDNTFIDASVKGAPVLTEGIKPGGFFTKVLDVNIYVSDQIDDVSGHHSMMFSEQAAFGYVYKRLMSPLSGAATELMMDIDWNSARRVFEINMTYQAAVGGLKGTSTTTNNWLVDCIS